MVEAQKKNLPASSIRPSGSWVKQSSPTAARGTEDTGSDRPGGFDVFQRSVELNLAASVDPFARGYAVINASADPITGESTATVEEAALVTTSLPWNLTVQGGTILRRIRSLGVHPRS